MTPEQKQTVKRTWALIVPSADAAATLFYDKLFEIDAELKVLFQEVDLTSQKKKLLQALALTVASLDNLEDLAPHLSELGRRHADYGVVEAHYDTVGGALLWTLEQGLQEAWTPDVQDAWTAAYGIVSETMQAAATHNANNQGRSRDKAA